MVDVEAKLLALLARSDGDYDKKRRQEIEQRSGSGRRNWFGRGTKALARLAEFETVSAQTPGPGLAK